MHVLLLQDVGGRRAHGHRNAARERRCSPAKVLRDGALLEYRSIAVDEIFNCFWRAFVNYLLNFF